MLALNQIGFGAAPILALPHTYCVRQRAWREDDDAALHAKVCRAIIGTLTDKGLVRAMPADLSVTFYFGAEPVTLSDAPCDWLSVVAYATDTDTRLWSAAAPWRKTPREDIAARLDEVVTNLFSTFPSTLTMKS